ncbi:MAG TPA: cytochrome-c peroxidase [Polyangia bacterium]|jgi:hypothetical protein|nr:cytochrome-c peroxidase [Polyangia bacterium]
MKTALVSVSVLAVGFVVFSGCAGQVNVEPTGFGGSGGFSQGTAGFGGDFCAGQDGGIGTSKGFPGGGIGGGFGNATPQLGATVSLESAPPAISGGTLAILRDGKTAVASDPDRDRISVVDLGTRTIKTTITLTAGDEPGRIVEDAAGRVHVALRRGGALVTLEAGTFALKERRAVCAAPRGLAFDAKLDRVHVACAGGELVSMPAGGGPAARTLKLDRDLRDVVVDGDKLLVSRFRSAQVITLDAAGKPTQRLTPAVFTSNETRGGQRFSASTAWRMMSVPGGGGVAILHQRGLMDVVVPQAGGYGGGNPCDAIVQTAVTVMKAGTMPPQSPAIAGMVLPVDLAFSPDGRRVAMIAAGNASNASAPGQAPQLPRVFVSNVADVTNPAVGCRPDGTYGPCLPGMGFAGAGGSFENTGGATGTGGFSGVGGSAGASSPGAPIFATDAGAGDGPNGAGGNGMDPVGPPPQPSPTPFCPTTGPANETPEVVGEPIAVAYDGAGKVVVQTREPAMLHLASGAKIVLSTDSRADTGHTVFHANAGGFVACASCHAEGTEDGRVWNFACEGPRRTQTLAAGISGTEPFHWGGDMKTFSHLMENVFMGRMSGPKLAPEQMMATVSWIDRHPRAPASPPADVAAVDRGRTMFNDSAKVGCVTCHTGARYTNNKNADVGTGGLFQVPSLSDVGSRAPFMHDGCASNLSGRFSPTCGGGDKHGVTSHLSAAELTDLMAFLETL